MQVINRATQFLTYECYNGLKQKLKQKEIEHTEKIELCEEQCEILSFKLNNLEKKKRVSIKYYENNRYVTKIGIISQIDMTFRKIVLDEKYVIHISDILDILEI